VRALLARGNDFDVLDVADVHQLTAMIDSAEAVLA
jgi:hypothetical protein